MNPAPALASPEVTPAAVGADAGSPAHAQADALIEEMAQRVRQLRGELLAAAEQEAQQIRRRARTKARQRLRRAIADMRAAEGRRLQQLQAELETAGRQQDWARAQQSLAVAWPRLAAALQARWDDRAARARWIAAQLALARARLPGRDWTVHHPGSCDAGECDALRAALARQGVEGVTLRADEHLGAGLVIEVGGARLDGSPAALLADRVQVEAALLALLEPAAAPGAPA